MVIPEKCLYKPVADMLYYFSTDIMQGSWVRIPRGPATVMRAMVRDKPGRCVCPARIHDRWRGAHKRCGTITAAVPVCVAKTPFRDGKGVLFFGWTRRSATPFSIIFTVTGGNFRMKRKISLLIIFAMLLALCACGGQTVSSDPPATDTPPVSQGT